MGTKLETVSEQIEPPLKKLGSRHVQSFMLFLAMAIAYASRVCLSVAIVPMEKQYNWSHAREGTTILSSFFWGYVITQLPSGHLANSRSAQKLLAFGMFTSSVLNMLTPFLCEYGVTPVIICRVIMGLLQGCLLPCVQTLLSRWVPPMERARLGSFVMNGPQFGTVVTMPVCGLLAISSIGWQSIFYIFGIIGVIWSVAFFFLGADRPSEHPRICPLEARYIDSSLGNLNKVGMDQKPITPWKKIFLSLPMWALVIAHMGHNWGFYMLLTQLPTYMSKVLNFKISDSGIISALPYLAMWLLGFPTSYVADFVLRKGVSILMVRKVCNTIGLWVPAIAMLLLGIIDTTDKTVVVAILVVAVGFNSGVTCGLHVNHIDLSPNYAGIMMSISNGAANVLGIVAPLVCGAVVIDTKDANQWHIIFYITAGIYFGSNLFFLICGKADVQSWNEDGVPAGAPTRGARMSVISLGGEPTSVTIPDHIEEECKTPC